MAKTQYGALPVIRDADGLKVVLVSSRGTGKWIIPKGWPMKGKKPHEAAAIEAFEEAGIIGPIREEPIGSYRYRKIRRNGRAVLCEVKVFVLEVETLLDDWPERAQRNRDCLTPAQAALQVEEGGLVELMLTVGMPAD